MYISVYIKYTYSVLCIVFLCILYIGYDIYYIYMQHIYVYMQHIYVYDWLTTAVQPKLTQHRTSTHTLIKNQIKCLKTCIG